MNKNPDIQGSSPKGISQEPDSRKLGFSASMLGGMAVLGIVIGIGLIRGGEAFWAGIGLFLVSGILLGVVVQQVRTSRKFSRYASKEELPVELLERKVEEVRLRGQNLVLDMLGQELPLQSILDTLDQSIEEQILGVTCSILLVNSDGTRLVRGSAPNMPEQFYEMVEGLKIRPDNGACGTAAYTRETIIVEDIETSPLWGGKYREQALANNFRSCWSTPILNASGDVLGTFAIYGPVARKPDEFELRVLRDAGKWASLAIERKKDQDKLDAHRDNLEQLIKERTLSLEEAKKEAERSNQAKTEFLSQMSHELRTPLNAILGFTQLLKLDQDIDSDPVKRKQIEYVFNAGNHLLDLINEILDFSKIESGKIQIEIQPLVLSFISKEIFSLLQPMADERGISFELNETGEENMALADPIRIKQVLLNLISNAIKYNKPGGQVEVKIFKQEPGWVCLQVIDTGNGIPSENFDSVFEPFYRLKEVRSQVNGTGIGLTISRQLVELMKGKLTLSSELEKGSCFSVVLPEGFLSGE